MYKTPQYGANHNLQTSYLNLVNQLRYYINLKECETQCAKPNLKPNKFIIILHML
jgi:hypothetical protein